MLEFVNFNGLLHCCSKDFNCLTKCKHLLEKVKKKEKKQNVFTLHLMALMFDHKILTVLSNVGGCGAAREADIRTHSAWSGANLRGSLHWPWPDKVPVDETSFISSCCCRMGAEASTNQLKDSGAKRWKPRSAELQAWSKGMRPGLGEAAELIGPALRLWRRRRSQAPDSFRWNHVFPGIKWSHPFSLFFLSLSLSLNLSWDGLGWNWCGFNYLTAAASSRTFMLQCQELKKWLFLYMFVSAWAVVGAIGKHTCSHT